MWGLRSRSKAQAEGTPTNGSSRAAEMSPIAGGRVAERRGDRLARRGDALEPQWSPPSGASLRASSRAPSDSPLQRQVAERERLAADERAQREGNKEKRRRESTAVHADLHAVDELEDDLDEQEEAAWAYLGGHRGEEDEEGEGDVNSSSPSRASLSACLHVCMSACLQNREPSTPSKWRSRQTSRDEEEVGAPAFVLDVEPRPRSGVWSRRRRRHPWRRFGLVRMRATSTCYVQSSSVHFRFSHVRACGKVKLYTYITPNSRGRAGPGPAHVHKAVTRHTALDGDICQSVLIEVAESESCRDFLSVSDRA